MSDKQSLSAFLRSAKGKSLAKAMFDAAQAFARVLKDQLNHPGTGKRSISSRAGSPQYAPADAQGKRAKLPRPDSDYHIRSVRGRSPAPDTTHLRESATAQQSDASGLRYHVGVHAPSPLALETTLDRPFMKPAYESWRETAGKHFTAARKA